MTASLPTNDRRPIPTVAIVGNDAVLAAAPATPVQLAHACLRRGFSVAVPASWGDELVAAETVRRLVGRDRGPAVMCVCPYVRSRLFARGSDLAPFLVSLIAPPVAAARYLRAVYGEHGVDITYIGACPSADDPAIDTRLTPDAFLADLAERGIALSEQPLVFDSIVPPDRRRWFSVPGGAPNAELLWNDADTRTLIEIDRDDASTDLAQHIIAREHVLLDLAPGLGCACSGAIPSLSPRGARVAVTALEPPRALGPVVDPATVVSLEAPVGAPPFSSRAVILDSPPNVDTSPAVHDGDLDAILDQMLGQAVTDDPDDVLVGEDFAAAVTGPDDATPTQPETTASSSVTHPGFDPDRSIERVEQTDDAIGDALWPAFAHTAADTALKGQAEPAVLAVPRESSAPLEVERDIGTPSSDADSESMAESDVETLIDSAVESFAEDDIAAPRTGHEPPVEPIASPDVTRSTRRRTPVSTPVRQPAASIPRAVAAGGQSLPRAYVGRRRTPTAGIRLIDETAAAPTAAPTPAPTAAPDAGFVAAPSIATPASTSSSPLVSHEVTTAAQDAGLVGEALHGHETPVPLTTTPVDSIEPGGAQASSPALIPNDGPGDAPGDAHADALASLTTEPAPVSAAPPARDVAPPRPQKPDAKSRSGPVIATPTTRNQGPFVFLLVAALLALAVWVLMTLRR